MRPRGMIEALAFLALVVGAYKIWEAKVRAEERWKIEQKALVSRLDSLWVELEHSEAERAHLASESEKAKRKASSALQQADSLRTLLGWAESPSDSVQILLSENTSLRATIQAQQEAIAMLEARVSSSERDLAKFRDLNVDLRQSYERLYKKAHPSTLGKLTRDLPEKLAWSAAAIILYEGLVDDG